MGKTLTVPSEGAELAVSVRGAGPLCLVMSSIGSAPYQRQLPAALDSHLTLAFVDLRGTGRSTGAITDLTFDRAAQDLDAVRAALGAERAVVFGHSVLGAVAIEAGRRLPRTLTQVVAVGAPADGDMVALQGRQRAFFEADASPERKQLLQQNLAALTPASRPEQFLFAQTPMRFFDPRFDAAPLFEGAVTNPPVLAHLMGALVGPWKMAGAAPPLSVPLLLAHGRHDYIVPWVEWQPLLAQLPTATFQLFERSGHQPFCEEPDRFTSVLTGWLKSARS
jgi:proline iminopeptidase